MCAAKSSPITIIFRFITHCHSWTFHVVATQSLSDYKVGVLIFCAAEISTLSPGLEPYPCLHWEGHSTTLEGMHRYWYAFAAICCFNWLRCPYDLWLLLNFCLTFWMFIGESSTRATDTFQKNDIWQEGNDITSVKQGTILLFIAKHVYQLPFIFLMLLRFDVFSFLCKSGLICLDTWISFCC